MNAVRAIWTNGRIQPSARRPQFTPRGVGKTTLLQALAICQDDRSSRERHSKVDYLRTLRRRLIAASPSGKRRFPNFLRAGSPKRVFGDRSVIVD